jgi:hypothetical protein
MLLVPAMHALALNRAPDRVCDSQGCKHGQPEPASHNADHCPICKLACVSFAVVVPDIAPVVSDLAMEVFRIPVNAPSARLAHQHPFSCGPPA